MYLKGLSFMASINSIAFKTLMTYFLNSFYEIAKLSLSIRSQNTPFQLKFIIFHFHCHFIIAFLHQLIFLSRFLILKKLTTDYIQFFKFLQPGPDIFLISFARFLCLSYSMLFTILL